MSSITNRTCVLALAALMGLAATSTAFGAMGTVKEQKTAGAYRLVLMIGPAEQMNTNMGSTQAKHEMIITPKKADCSMKAGHMADSFLAVGMKMCNHHVELHVYKEANGQVVHGAHVSISLRDSARHMTITVPVAVMMGMGPGGGMSDYHYGNNIYAAPGMYTVTTRVNGVKAAFSAHLM